MAKKENLEVGTNFEVEVNGFSFIPYTNQETGEAKILAALTYNNNGATQRALIGDKSVFSVVELKALIGLRAELTYLGEIVGRDDVSYPKTRLVAFKG